MQSEKNKNKYETPIADFLVSNTKNLEVNFHALPIFNFENTMDGFEKYENTFGEKYLSLETTIGGKIFDSFFYPIRCFKKSQNLASQAFKAKDTLFVTCGTTISNYIATDAVINEGSNVLLDRECHQSLHFAVNAKKVKYDYFNSQKY